MDTAAQWPPQDIAAKSMEEIISGTPKPNCPSSVEQQISRKSRPQKEQALNCPRCNSTNTKFCYYNNYSLTQPRYFCKTCRRYWTEGGSLRNIPVGGGSRKNKRSSSSSTSSNRSSSSSSSKIKLPDLVVPQQQNPNQNIVANILDHHHQIQKQDLNLGFSIHSHHDFKAITDMIRVPNFDNKLELPNNPCSGGSFMSFPILADASAVNYSSGFNFSLDGLGGNYGSFQGVEESNGKLLFPFEDLKQDDGADNSRNDDAQGSRDGATTGFWNGVIGGGSW